MQAKDGSLRVATPTMETDPSATPGAWLRAQKEKEKELSEKKKKSNNWLLEAMEKDRKPDGEVVARPTEADQVRALLAGERPTETPATSLSSAQASATDEKGKEKPAAPQVVNPLTRFMSDWMSPKDYALLQSTPGVAAPKESVVGAGGSTPSPDTGGSVASVSAPGGGGLESLFGTGPGGRAPTSPPPRENPFLQGLQPIPTGTAGPTFSAPALAPLPPMPNSPAPATGFQPAPATELASPRANAPDFARPTYDDKAFKPMKRF